MAPALSKTSAQDQISDLEARKKIIDAKIDGLNARRFAQQRKDDDRRIVLLGKILFDDLPNDKALRDYARRRLPQVMRDSDHKRGLFSELLKEKSK